MVEGRLFVISLFVMIVGLCFCIRLDYYDRRNLLKPWGEFLCECCVVAMCSGFLGSLIFLGIILHKVW